MIGGNDPTASNTFLVPLTCSGFQSFCAEAEAKFLFADAEERDR